jgi:hypothetical protein
MLGGLAFLFIGLVLFYDKNHWMGLVMAIFSSLYALRYALALGKNSYYLKIGKDGITIRRMYIDLFIPRNNIKRFNIQKFGGGQWGKYSMFTWVIFLEVKSKLKKGSINKTHILMPAPIDYDNIEIRNALIDLAGT